MRTGVRLSLSDRFWPKVERRGPTECWPWLGTKTGTAKDTHRYGLLGATPASRFGPAVPSKRAHVASWEIANGQSVPSGMVIRHACDEPLCVNPAHLQIGRQADNVADRQERGRAANRHGDRNPNSRLTAETVAEIRSRHRDGATQRELAERYGVNQPQISRIVRGQNWTETFTGDPAPVRRLTPAQIAEMRARYAAGERQSALAIDYRVTQVHVSRIVRRVRWTD